MSIVYLLVALPIGPFYLVVLMIGVSLGLGLPPQVRRRSGLGTAGNEPRRPYEG